MTKDLKVSLFLFKTIPMRLTTKKIEEILLSLLGEDGAPLIRELLKQDNTSEFQLATKTKKDIKVIRKMLYILYNNNLVSFTRKKDKEKGWYIYSWTLVPESVKYSYYKKKKDRLELLQKILGEEQKELFFSCPNQCVRLNFDQATDFEFHCPECGKLLSQDTNEEKIATLKKELEVLQKEIFELSKETHPKEKIKEVKESKKITSKKNKKSKKKAKK